MERKSTILANAMIYGVPFRVVEGKREKSRGGKITVTMMAPDGKPLHEPNTSVRVRARGKDDAKVLKTVEKIITKQRERVIEWLKAGLLPEATPQLLLLVLPEESLKKVYGKGMARRELLERVVEALPPLAQLEEKAEAETIRAIERVATGYTEKKALRAALNRLYNEMVNEMIWKKNAASKALAVKRTTTEKADRNLRQRALSLEEMRQLTNLCLKKQEEDPRYAAVLLQLATGVSAGEACALNVGGILYYKDVTFIEIHAKLKQKRYELAEWEPYDRESGRIRRVSCTPLAQVALRTLLKPRLEAGAGAGAPLLVDEQDKRMEVLAYRIFVRKVLEKVVAEYAELSRTDILRTSFEMYCRTRGGVTADRVRKLQGLKAEQTFEEWYADYDAHLALLILRAQLERWQHEIMDNKNSC